MKKLFFSAVALIAFSSVSMGNTIEVEELKIVETFTTEINCRSYAASAVSIETAALGRPMTYSEFAKAYSEYFNFCELSKSLNMTPLLPVIIP